MTNKGDETLETASYKPRNNGFRIVHVLSMRMPTTMPFYKESQP